MKTSKNAKVLELAQEILESSVGKDGKKNGRYSASQFIDLIPAIMTDKSYKGKKIVYKAGQKLVEEVDFTKGAEEFCHKILKHAGIKSEEERQTIIDTFEFKPKDVKYMLEVVEEAMYIYSTNGKFMKIFEDKDLTLAFQKMARNGKYKDQVTFKKKSVDKIYLERKKAAK